MSKRKENWLRPPSETGNRRRATQTTGVRALAGPASCLGLSHPSATGLVSRMTSSWRTPPPRTGAGARTHSPQRPHSANAGLLAGLPSSTTRGRTSLHSRKQASAAHPPLPDFLCVATSRLSRRHVRGGASSEPPVTPPTVPLGGAADGLLRKGAHRAVCACVRGGGLRLCGTEARVWCFRGSQASYFRVMACSICVTACVGPFRGISKDILAPLNCVFFFSDQKLGKKIGKGIDNLQKLEMSILQSQVSG